ncbi:Dabb family protein [Polaromonas sp. P1(28)-13]|nr:Dabb family protein [Polaromonas sp. P1(28)-13]
MIKHIVMWNVRGNSAEEKQEALEQIRQCFEGLRGRIPGLLHLEVGIDTSRISYACDIVLYTEFSSVDALEAYGVHPEHERVKTVLIGLRTERHQVDYQPSATASGERPRVASEAVPG